jgi:tRNA-splicing ligase RtcB/release factor H-coupled RctB family protein
MKKSEKEAYKAKFPEWLEKNGEFENGVIQEFDFAYKDSSTILSSQPYLIPVTKTSPIVTVKFTAI